MKAVILAGGYGTRLSEETNILPKPMVKIGGKPILWHIMKTYSHFGINDFVILCGYMNYSIKEYFANYFLHQSDVTIYTSQNKLEIHNNSSEDWKITLVDTGEHTMTGGRILKAKKYLEDETFLLTYGDGLADINIKELVNFHITHKKILTVTSVQPEGRFGAMDVKDNNQVTQFLEKPQGDGYWINGGFFVCEPKIFDYLKDGDQTIFERSPMENLARGHQLYSYKHTGFWKCMDTLRDKTQLEEMWNSGNPKWKVWI